MERLCREEGTETPLDGRGPGISGTSQGSQAAVSNLNLERNHLLGLLEHRPWGPLPRASASVALGQHERRDSCAPPLLPLRDPPVADV